MEVQIHFSPLNSTFLHCSSKNNLCKRAYNYFFNEIKDLEAISQALEHQNMF